MKRKENLKEAIWALTGKVEQVAQAPTQGEVQGYSLEKQDNLFHFGPCALLDGMLLHVGATSHGRLLGYCQDAWC